MRSGRGSPSIRLVTIATISLAWVVPGRAEAQYYGYGYGYGYGGGLNTPFGNVGMSLYDQEAAKQLMYEESVSRYQLQNAQAVEAFQAACLMRQQAISTALENQRQAVALSEKYNAQTQAPQAEQAAGPTPPPPIPLGELIDSEGKVRWPDGAPVGGDLAAKRQEADAAIQAAYQKRQGRGQASVEEVVEAKQALYAYGQPALARLRASDVLRGRVSTVLPFLQNLEAAVDSLGGAAPSG